MDIVISRLYKSFAGRPVLENFSAVFAEGGCTALMGPSGRGKTTLLRILMGLEKADAGKIEGISGKKLAAVFQEDRLLPSLSARKNLLAACPGITEREAQKMLDELGLEESGTRPIPELSGGMKRRVAIARALLHAPQLLLLDEPFSGMDTVTRSRAAACICTHAAGATLLLVTHSPDEAQLLCAQKILQMGK